MQRGLGFSPSALTWVVNAYAIPFGGLLLLAGRLGDLHGTYVLDFLPASLVVGLGFGLAAPAMMGLGMAAVAPQDAGVASWTRFRRPEGRRLS